MQIHNPDLNFTFYPSSLGGWGGVGVGVGNEYQSLGGKSGYVPVEDTRGIKKIKNERTEIDKRKKIKFFLVVLYFL